uniref:Immunoglobulin superfamily, member 10 n=1 Tax=Acanthochromis polyacanthus TaxID=80966 RepID=A0A3Q1FMQ7_9TELE
MCACSVSYLWRWLLEVLLFLAAVVPSSADCPKSCVCYVPTEVHCTFRYLTAIPDHIQPAVERINLGYNSITVVRENGLSGLESLELLMLHSNTIHSIEDRAFQDLKSLQVLKMSFNKVKEINKETFKGLNSLLRLHIDHNHIEFISPEAFYGLTNLQLVHLEGNHLQQLHPDTFITLRHSQIFKVSSIRSIHLSDNLLTSLPADIFSGCSQLENLFLHGNPWTCDCRMTWFSVWAQRNTGVLKCKRDRRYPRGQLCPVCENPAPYQNRPLSLLHGDSLTCTKAWIQPYLKQKNISLDQGDFTPVSPKDFIAPLGSIQMNLTDQFHNDASLSCTVQRPTAFKNLRQTLEVEEGNNVTVLTTEITTYLVCNINYEHIQPLWQILASYSDSPMKLERGLMLGRSPEVVYRYSQIKTKDKEEGFNTNIEADIKASPPWLMQGEISFQLDRTTTTFSTLHIKYQSEVNLRVDDRSPKKDRYSWTMIKRDNHTKTEHTVLTGGVAQLTCQIQGEPKPLLEWILPDGSKVRAPFSSDDRRIIITAEGKLTVRGADSSDTGLYWCIATNYLDADILVFRVTVLSHDVEEAEVNGVQLSRPLGENLVLDCSSSGSPAAVVSWVLPDHSVLYKSQDNRKVYENGTLLIQGLTERDRGFYRCLVANHLGFDLLVSQVTVTEGRPESALTALDSEGSGMAMEVKMDSSLTGNTVNLNEIPSPNAADRNSQESRTITSDRPFPRHRSQGRGGSGARLGQRRRGPVRNRHIWSSRVFDKASRKVDPQKFAEFMKKAQHGSRKTGTKNERGKYEDSHTGFSGDDDIGSGEIHNEDHLVAIPSTVKPTTENPHRIYGKEGQTETTHTDESVDMENTFRNPIDFNNCNSDEDRKKTVTTDLQVVTPTASSSPSLHKTNRLASTQKAAASTTNNYITSNAPGTHTESSSEVYTEYITSADAPEFGPTTDPFLTPKKAPSVSTTTPTTTASKVIRGRIPWNRLFGSRERERILGRLRRPFSTLKTSTTAQTTTMTLTTTPAAVPTTTANSMAEPETLSPSRPTQSRESSLDDDYGDSPSADFEFTTLRPSFHHITTTSASDYSRSSTTAETPPELQTLLSPPTVKPYSAKSPDEALSSGSGGLPDNLLVIRQRPGGTRRWQGRRRRPFRGRRPFRKPVITTTTEASTTELTTVETTVEVTTKPEKAVSLYKPLYTLSRKEDRTAVAVSVDETSKEESEFDGTSSSSSTYTPSKTPLIISTTYNPTTTLMPASTKGAYTAVQTRVHSNIRPPTQRNNGDTNHRPPLGRVRPTVSSSVARGSADKGHIIDTMIILMAERGYHPSTPAPHKKDIHNNAISTVYNQVTGYESTITNTAGFEPTTKVMTNKPKILGGNAASFTVLSNSDAFLPCEAVGNPQPVITWKRFSSIRGQNTVKGRVSVSAEGTLVIEDVSVYDRGHYKCIASNPAGADTATVRLQVVAAPPGIIEEKRKQLKASQSQTLWLPCTGHGTPQPTVHWVLHDGSVVRSDKAASDTRILMYENGTLRIRDVTPAQSGKYECIATSSTGSERRVVTLTVETQQSAPQIVETSQRLTELSFGDQLRLNCAATGDPKPRIMWRLPSKAVVDHWHRMGSRIQVLENGTLIVNTLTDKDAGDYLCVARSKIGDDLQLMRVSISMKPAKIETKLYGKKQVPYGNDLKVDCKASGAPKPEISWGLPDGTVVNSALQSDASGRSGGGRTRRYTLFDNGTLYLNQVGMSEEGDYTCYAENQVGKDEMHVHITVVTAAPRIRPPSQTYARVKPGGNIRFDCEAHGEPKPKILWMLPTNDVIAASNERYLMHVNGSLDIRDVKLVDAGEYVCVARNPGGENREIYKLEIDGNPPVINGYRQNRTVITDVASKFSRKLLDCKAEGDPTPTITWIMPDNIFLKAPYFGSRINVHHNGTLEIRNVRPTDTAEFICMARNDGGEAVMVVQLEVTSLLKRPIFKNPFNERVVSRFGKTTVLNCSADGHPRPEIVWTLPNGTRVIGGSHRDTRHHLGNDGTLIIYNPRKEDTGKYRCGAKNFMGYIEKLIILDIGQKPYILTRPRGIIRSVSGEPLFLHCLSDGSPRPRIYWTIPGGHTLTRPQVLGRYKLLENGTLIVQDTTLHDQGNYICRARNDAGEAGLTVPVVIIAYPPRITTGPPPSVRAVTGTAFQLNCAATGIPKPDIIWELPDHSVLSAAQQGRRTGSELLHPQGTLIIQRPKPSDSGTYKCLAKNHLGTDSKVTYVLVQ